MEDLETAERDDPRLSVPAQTYVALVGLVAVASTVADSTWLFAALFVLTMPLSLVAAWVAFYSTLAVGFVAGHSPSEMSLPVGLVWVAVWVATAWINAGIGERIARSGWQQALGRRPSRESDLEP